MAENAITWRLGVDKSQLTAGLKSAEAEALASSQKIAQGMGHAAEGGEKIFTSSHRAAGQIRILTQELARGAQAGDIFAAGLEAAERVLRVPLGSLAALAVAGIIVKQLHDVADADEKLKRQLATSLDPSPISDYGAAVETLAERFKNTAEAIAESQRRLNDPTRFEKIIDALGDVRPIPRGGNLPTDPKVIAQQFATASPSEINKDAARTAIALAQAQERLRLELQINEARRSGGDVETKIADLAVKTAQINLDALKKAYPKDDDQSGAKRAAQGALDAANAEKQITEEKKKQRELDDKQAASQKERFGMSLKELAEGRGGSPETEFERRQARRATGERAESERLRLRGDEQGAAVRAGRAEHIEAGIQGLKPSENMANEVRAGVDGAQITQRIQELISVVQRNAII
jgi:hypothetical protein